MLRTCLCFSLWRRSTSACLPWPMSKVRRVSVLLYQAGRGLLFLLQQTRYFPPRQLWWFANSSCAASKIRLGAPVQ